MSLFLKHSDTKWDTKTKNLVDKNLGGLRLLHRPINLPPKCDAFIHTCRPTLKANEYMLCRLEPLDLYSVCVTKLK